VAISTGLVDVTAKVAEKVNSFLEAVAELASAPTSSAVPTMPMAPSAHGGVQAAIGRQAGRPAGRLKTGQLDHERAVLVKRIHGT
jgi:hypothetical protein